MSFRFRNFRMGPIRNKLIAGLVVLLVMLGTLATSGLIGFYSYRGLVKDLRGRANELPLASKLATEVSDLRVAYMELLRQLDKSDILDPRYGVVEFQSKLLGVQKVLSDYRHRVSQREVDDGNLLGTDFERKLAEEIDQQLLELTKITLERDWYDDSEMKSDVQASLNMLQIRVEALPRHLHESLTSLADSVRTEYHVLIGVNWVTSVAATCLLSAFVYLFYRWIHRPLSVLVEGSRRVAAGDFKYRIQLHSQDEMAELGTAFNQMTARFEEIRDDLDRQVQERTKQVIRNEQLASVGFLAAGVAHEINNPLASIAMCAESLEGRLRDLNAELGGESRDPESIEIVRKYLDMIQSEAFRCKEITEKLLDFSRLGNAQRQVTDLRELVGSVVDMVGHLDKYHDRQIVMIPESLHDELAIAEIVQPEIKQVVLNMITNALDSLDSGGTLNIKIQAKPQHKNFVEMIFSDNGCGMTPDVLEHLFEPFFTRKRHGQGTGLGLSITYRIVADHGGTIDASSAGLGQGSQFVVTLPRAALDETGTRNNLQKENSYRYQAA
jgi:two-component system, NtrC family, sensor kinase